MCNRCFCTIGVVLLLTLALTGPVEAELAGWWPMNDGAGTTAIDATGNGNDATFNGDPQWVVGQLDGALEFDGAGDWLECADGGTLAIGEAVSMAAWIKVGGQGLDHKIGGNQDNANGGYKMSIYSNNMVEFEIRTAANNAVLNRNSAGGTVLEVDTWYHVFGVYSLEAGYIRTYVNGVLDRELATTDELGVSPGPLRLGCEPYTTGSYHFNGVMDDVRVYDHAVTAAEMPLIMLGGRPAELASDPQPADEADDIPRDVVLSWMPGSTAATHDVYFGMTFEDVNNADRGNPMGVLPGQDHAQASFDPDGLLEFGQKYYWRVDEVNAAPDNAIFKGDIWNFTTEPFAYPIENIVATSNVASEAGLGPENTINGSGLNELDQHSSNSGDMWQIMPAPGETPYIQYEFDTVYKLYEMMVWNYNVQFEPILGFGPKDVTVEYSTDGVDWVALGDVVFAQATARPDYAANTTVAFEGVPAMFVRLTIHTGYGSIGQYGLSEVRFLHIPAQAREPEPADGAADVSVATALNWRAGREAVSHEVYLGTDAEALVLVDTTTATRSTPAALEMAMTYYWRVDEVNEADAISVWEGRIWSFDTEAFVTVDDFESYNDEDNVIYESWIDGWVNDTGSTVGYLVEPFAERSIVHSGSQSMPLFYDNVGVDTAEAELTLGQDWTTNGIQGLVLYFQGDPDNSGGQLYVKINDTRINYDGLAGDMRRSAWQLWSIDLSSVGNVSNVSSLIIGVEGAAAQGVLYIDDIRLCPEVLDDSPADTPDITRAGDVVLGVPNDNDWPEAEHPGLAIDDDAETKYLHRKGGAMATGFQIEPLVGSTVVTGLAFTSANDAAGRDPITFELSGSNTSIDGPYTLIAAGDIIDFAGAAEWPRLTKTETPIEFANTVAYQYYQIVFPTLRGATETLMQIAEVEFIGE